MKNKILNTTEITRIVEAIAGKLVCNGVTTSNFNNDRCKMILSNCVLSNKLTILFEEYSLNVYHEIANIQNLENCYDCGEHPVYCDKLCYNCYYK